MQLQVWDATGVPQASYLYGMTACWYVQGLLCWDAAMLGWLVGLAVPAIPPPIVAGARCQPRLEWPQGTKMIVGRLFVVLCCRRWWATGMVSAHVIWASNLFQHSSQALSFSNAFPTADPTWSHRTGNNSHVDT